MIHRLPITYYSDRIRANDHYSLVRYGDGEFHCMWGRLRKNCDGCRCTAELRADLGRTLIHGDDPNFLYGLQRILPEDMQTVFECQIDPPIKWHDSEIFTEALVAGGLFPLIDALRQRDDLVFVGSVEKCALVDHPTALPIKHFIPIPPRNTHAVKANVLESIRQYGRPGCYVFAAGMTANCLISELHGTTDAMRQSFLLDLGHIFDIFVGVRRRRYQRRMSEAEAQALIEKNLRPPRDA